MFDHFTITLLLACLSSNHFQTRETASAALLQCGPLALPHLRHGAESKDPEVRYRCQRLLNEIEWAPIREMLRYPFIDVLPNGYPKRHETIYGYVAKAEERYPQLDRTGWPHWRIATKLLLEDLAARGEDPAPLLERMTKRCGHWTGYTPVPPDDGETVPAEPAHAEPNPVPCALMARWPSLPHVRQQLRLNDIARQQCELMVAVNPNRDHGAGEQLAHLDESRWYWRTLEEAWLAGPEWRECVLDELRRWMSEEAWWAGRLPEAVPWKGR